MASADRVQRPVLFDYTRNSRELPLIPGFRLEYRMAGEASMAEAYELTGQGPENAEKAAKKYDEAADWFHEAEDDYRRAEALKHEASVRWRVGGSADAVEDLKRAVFLYGRAGATSSRAYALADWAEIESGKSSPQTALDYLSQALEIASSEGDVKETEVLLQRMANIYTDAGETAIAHEYERLIPRQAHNPKN
jgi:tetratricopeptide (TPR) repeat protein